MKPILFASTATDFSTNGIGRLNPTECVVTEEKNGEFELKLTVPIEGAWAEYIDYRSIICAKPSPGRKPQPFRVYRIVSEISGLRTVYAHHLSYDLSGIILQTYDAANLSAAMTGLTANASTPCAFTFAADFAKSGDFSVSVPVSIRAALGDGDTSILGLYGGEFEWDCYKVKLHNQRGAQNGVTIAYGKNLTNFQQDANCASVYTGIYPYYADSDGNYCELDGCVLHVGSHDYVKILPVDLTDYFTTLKEDETPAETTDIPYGQGAPTKEQLLEVAKQYIADNEIGVPDVSIDIDFVQLSQCPDYADIAVMEDVELCDWVTVKFPQMGVSANAEVVAIEYDVLAERYTNITVGNANADFVSAQSTLHQQTQQSLRQTRYTLESSIKQTAEAITLQVSKTYVSNDGLADTLTGYYTKDETNSAITQSAENISLTVNKTLTESYTTTADMNTAIGNAKQAAIETAAGDATSKADAAKAAAIKDTDTKLSNYSTTKAMTAAIEESAEQIKLSVSKIYVTTASLTGENGILAAYAKTEAVNSAIDQKAESITSTVTKTLTESYSTTAAMNKAISDAKDAAIKNTNDKLTDYATKTYVQNYSKIEQTDSQIKLTVGSVTTTAATSEAVSTAQSTADSAKSAANTAQKTADGKVSTGSVRKSFENETSDVTVSKGIITFNTKTLIINANNFKLDADGNATYTGTLKADSISVYDSSSSTWKAGASGTFAFVAFGSDGSSSGLKTIGLRFYKGVCIETFIK